MLEDLQIIKYVSLASTQDEAKKLLKEKKVSHGYVIATDNQIKGKGRYNRSWIAQKGDLACTFILRPEMVLEFFTQISFVSAIAVGDFIKKYNTTCEVNYKWPNDVMIDRKKFSGILLELLDNTYLLVGIGINVKSKKIGFPISSLEDISDKKTSFNKLVHELTNCFKAQYSNWCNFGFPVVKNLWLKKAMDLNKIVEVNILEKKTKGQFCEIDEYGNMILKVGGKKKKVKIGEIFSKNA